MSYLIIIIIVITPRPLDGGIMDWWLSSVCPFLCPVYDHKSIMEGHSKLKAGRKEAHETGDAWSILEGKRSKVKVTG